MWNDTWTLSKIPIMVVTIHQKVIFVRELENKWSYNDKGNHSFQLAVKMYEYERN